jgi:hypothetical protein
MSWASFLSPVIAIVFAFMSVLTWALHLIVTPAGRTETNKKARLGSCQPILVFAWISSAGDKPSQPVGNLIKHLLFVSMEVFGFENFGY